MTACDCPIGPPVGATLATTCPGNMYMIFMALLEVFLRSQCDIEDPCGRIKSRTAPDMEYDFIVVGSGPGGSVVASRLSEVPNWKVLLVEAGGHEPVGTQVPSMAMNFIGTDIDWKYYTEPETKACLSEKEHRCFWPRGKVLGGTSVINGMSYIRGNREDYDRWERMGNLGWSYKDVLPYFLKSENNLQLNEMDQGYHATGGPLTLSKFPYTPPMSYAILQAAQELGYNVGDLNGKNSTGFMLAQTTSRNGVRMSTSRAFLRPARNRQNLYVLLNSTVTKVLIDPEGATAQGVEIMDAFGHKTKAFATKEVILSGGTINSPQILMLSGIGPKEELMRVGISSIIDLPGVGKNLHDHVSYYTKFNINEPNTNLMNWDTAREYILFRNGPVSGTGIGDVTGKIVSKYAKNPNAPDLQFMFGGYFAQCSQNGKVGELVNNKSRNIVIVPVVNDPKSRGYITLASSNPLDKPKIVANYFHDERDLKSLVEGVRFAIKLSETPALKAYEMKLNRSKPAGCEHFEFGTDAFWECAVQHDTVSAAHEGGTCKMGPPNDPMAVVDNVLRVYGVNGLRVVDASIMPKITNGNLMASTIMIGEKAASDIKSAWEFWDYGYRSSPSSSY